MLTRRVHRICLTLLGGIASTSPVRAHIDLQVPEPRSPGRPGTTLPQGPCGQRVNERRADTVNVFQPGQTIDVVWEAYVQHVSYFRIAFDADGDDSFSSRPTMPSDPAADDPTRLPANEGETILAYVEDRTGDIERVEERVTLPNVACENCTLQLIQFTYGLPIDNATYHQCADLVLEGPPAAGETPGSSATTPSVDPDADRSSGCSFGPPQATPAWLLPWLCLGMAVLRRRQRGRRVGSTGRSSRSHALTSGARSLRAGRRASL
jgi:hypothetical protein